MSETTSGEIGKRQDYWGLGPDTYVDLIDQYYPAGKVSGTAYVEISSLITPKEYRLALEAARDAGLRRLDDRAPDKHLAIWQ